MSMYADDILSNNAPRKFRLTDIYDAIGSKKFFENVRKSKSSPFSEIMTITPQDARDILAKNPNNRPINQSLIKTIAEDIASNRWLLNGESIIISRDGELNDGQHRLLAVLLANRSVTTLIFFGADRESRHTVDMGKARSVSHLLSMENIQNANQGAAIAKMYLYYKNNKFADSGNLFATKQRLRQEFIDNRQKIEHAIATLASQKFAKVAGITPICAAYIAIKDVSPNQCDDFFLSLLTGENMSSGNPILKAREHLIGWKERKASAQQRMEVIFRYWNAWRRGIKCQRSLAMYSEWPEIEA